MGDWWERNGWRNAQWLAWGGIGVGLLILLTGCGRGYVTGEDSGSPREDFMLAENNRMAAKLSKHIEGHITDYIYMVDTTTGDMKVPAAGWYHRGKTYYWRDFVVDERYPLSYLTELAAHEVCHSVSLEHDKVWSDCKDRLMIGE